MPLRGTSKDENRGRSPVEPGSLTGAVSPSFSLAPGPLGTNNCRREHECQSYLTQLSGTPDVSLSGACDTDAGDLAAAQPVGLADVATANGPARRAPRLDC